MSRESIAIARPRVSVAHIAAAAAYGIAFLSLTTHFALYLRYALSAVQFPFGLDYGEGIIWQQALLIPGQRMYGDITHFPFLVFHYPPVYHLAVRVIAALGAPMLEAGRALSVFCTLMSGGLVAALANDVIDPNTGRYWRLAGAAAGGLTMYCYWPVVFWSPFMRIDMLAIMLSLLGVWLAGRSFRTPLLLYPAVLSFVLAVFTKQSSIAAPIAAMVVCLTTDRRLAFKAFGLGLLVGLIGLAALIWMTDGGFIRHILLYNLNRFSLKLAAWTIYQETVPHALFLIMALAGLIAGWRGLAGRGSRHAPLMAMLTLYLVLTSGTLVGLGKSGAAQNYFIEWMCVWSVMIGVLIAFSLNRTFGDGAVTRHWSVPALLLPAALVLQIAALPSGTNFGGDDPVRVGQLDALVDRIRDARQPVLSDDMVLLLKAGQEVPWEPAIFAELATTGRWNEQLIIDSITTRAWAFIVTEGKPSDLIYDSRFTPAVDRAIRETYPRTEEQGGRILHLPPA